MKATATRDGLGGKVVVEMTANEAAQLYQDLEQEQPYGSQESVLELMRAMSDLSSCQDNLSVLEKVK